MAKNIPAALLSHKAQQTTTICRLLYVVCVDGTAFGFANLDVDVVYSPGLGPNSPAGAVTFRSNNGFTPVRIATAAGTSVDNTDLNGIVADLEALGITEHQIRSGKLDYADAWVLEVNYNDLTPGRHEIKERGNCGAVSMSGEAFTAEFRSLTQRLRQRLGEVTSITCRAKFGDARCGKSITWIDAAITAVSLTEPDRIFTAASLGQADSYFVPGLVEVVDGDNAGLQIEVETFAAGVVTLSLPAYFEFVPGVNIRISQNCTKDFDDADHGCLYHWAADRTLHFRGEPKIPLGQEGALATPGAEI